MGVDFMKKSFCFGDAIAYGGIIILFLLSFIGIRLFLSPKAEPKSVLVRSSSEVVRYPIDVYTELCIESNGYTLYITIDKGYVFVQETDCPNRLCRAQGKISKAGQSIVCIPAELIITVEGGTSDADIIVG